MPTLPQFGTEGALDCLRAQDRCLERFMGDWYVVANILDDDYQLTVVADSP
jgi:hypothetical protein